jgi:hypothetical protein
MFDFLEEMERQSVSVEDYYREFQSVSFARRNETGYAGDVKAEAQVRELIRKGEEFYDMWRKKTIRDVVCRDLLHETLVQLWCVKVKGKVADAIYWVPQAPKVYTPAIDNDLTSRIPPQLKLPDEDILLANYQYRPNPTQLCHSVLFYRYRDDRWYVACNLFDLKKNKWSSTRVSCMYGSQFRADLENQWWTQEGFDKAKADNRLDPQIPAVWCNYIKFYGRDEALRRLELPPLDKNIYQERGW